MKNLNSPEQATAPALHFIDDFKKFVLKKNAIDMALGITIGISFGKVISSLVNDIIMPPIGLIIGGVNLPDLKIILKKAIITGKQITYPEVAIHYGKFLQIALDFFIVAFSAFVVIKIVNNLIKNNDKTDIDWTEFIKK
jgi:large conductance mechanosensitive channel